MILRFSVLLTSTRPCQPDEQRVMRREIRPLLMSVWHPTGTGGAVALLGGRQGDCKGTRVKGGNREPSCMELEGKDMVEYEKIERHFHIREREKKSLHRGIGEEQ